jgi:hypothetical protein
MRSDQEPNSGGPGAGFPPGGAGGGDDDDDDAGGGGGGGNGGFPNIEIPRDMLARAIAARAAQNGPEGLHATRTQLEEDRGRRHAIEGGPTLEDVHRLVGPDGRSLAGTPQADGAGQASQPQAGQAFNSLLPEVTQLDLLRETARARDGHTRPRTSPQQLSGLGGFAIASGSGLFGAAPRSAMSTPAQQRQPRPGSAGTPSQSVDRSEQIVRGGREGQREPRGRSLLAQNVADGSYGGYGFGSSRAHQEVGFRTCYGGLKDTGPGC